MQGTIDEFEMTELTDMYGKEDQQYFLERPLATQDI